MFYALCGAGRQVIAAHILNGYSWPHGHNTPTALQGESNHYILTLLSFRAADMKRCGKRRGFGYFSLSSLWKSMVEPVTGLTL